MTKVGHPRLYADIHTKWRENKRRQRKAKQTQLRVYHRSTTEERATPQDFFDVLHAEFRFTLDVAAAPENAKCIRYFTKAENGLIQTWAPEICWCNPPYGRDLGQWMRKAFESAAAGATVVCLVPSRTEMQWWHTYAMRGEIRFVPGRLKFGNARYNAPFPSVVVIFRPTKENAP